MKDHTDFDALMAGASPEEGRRLRKILAEWTRGDEDAFPVQMALLTRAQWRSAAAVPRLVEEQRKALADVLAKAEGEIAATTREVQDSLRVQLTAHQAEVTRQSAALKDATATMRAHLEREQWGSLLLGLALVALLGFIAGVYVGSTRPMRVPAVAAPPVLPNP